MFKQFKYSWRIRFSQRMVALLATIGINLFFGIGTSLRFFGAGFTVTGIVFSSLSFCGILVVYILADADTIRSLFSTPTAYSVLLAPVPSWKVILGRVLPMVIHDVIGFSVGIIGIVAQGMAMTNLNIPKSATDIGGVVFLALTILLGYLMIIMAIFFWNAVSKSVFYRYRLRGLLGFGVTAAVLYIMSLLNFALLPFGAVERVGPWINVSISLGVNSGMFLALLIMLVQTGVLFGATAYLMERKINI